MAQSPRMKSQLRIACVLAASVLVLWGCAHSQSELAEVTTVRQTAKPQAPPKAAAPRTTEAPTTAGIAKDASRANPADPEHDVVLMAMAMLDRNYTYGGKRLHTGFDCSGFVSFVYREAGQRKLNGNASDQARQTQYVPTGRQRPGDLVFFNTTGSSNSHVGIYVGEGRFVHAENERTGIKSSRLDQSYWATRFEGFRRIP